MSVTTQYLAQASLELDQGTVDRGLWAMATSQALGDHRQAMAIYLRLRAEALAREALRATLEKVASSFPKRYGRRCVGVDGARHGWLAVWEEEGVLAFDLYPDPGTVWSAHREAVIAVDIPIGLSDRGPRAPDVEARRFVGGRRASSVFSAPVRSILDASTQPEASRRHRGIDGRGFGAQAFGILPHIRAWDAFLAGSAEARSNVYEVHPEVSFAALNDGVGLVASKKSPEGTELRKALLGREFGEQRVRELMAACPRDMGSADDVLDALVALWTARRIADGTALTLPKTPGQDSAGIRTAIYY